METIPPNPPSPIPSTGSWEPGPAAVSPPSGFKVACYILMALGGFVFLAGLMPCLGWVNWFGVPLNLVTALVGLIALLSGPKHADGSTAYQGVYIAALVVGGIGLIGGTLRCMAGGFVI